jgi:mannose-6-phosphate isomerase
MLSIQVHPSKTEAEKGFAHEEQTGIHISAPHRNYKDKNHKPEMMIALSEFWLLHGFKQKEQLKQTLNHIKEFESLIPIFNDGDYKALYSHVMLMQQAQADALLLSLIKKEIHLKEKHQLHKTDPGWWVAKLFEQKEVKDNFDKGIFSIYFFNILNLHPGQAIFQDAGLPHAYLEGQNIELMASSDNVLRGGLTNKHIDVPELMKHTLFEGIDPVIINGTNKPHGEKNYESAAADFGLSSITLKTGQVYRYNSSSLEILCIMDGELQITGSNHLQAHRGEAIAILPAEKYKIETPSSATIYKAFVP